MFKPEITSHSDHGVPAQSIYVQGHGTYDARTDTLELVTEHLAHYSVRELRSRMTRTYRTFEGEDPSLAGLRRAELLFIAAEYPSLYLPGMVQALGLKVDAEGRYWVPPTPEADQDDPTRDAEYETYIDMESAYDAAEADAPASPFVADPANPTDAELAAAIQRGLANGTLIDSADWLAAQHAIAVAATIRKTVSYPAYERHMDAHTSGMAELISQLTGQPYSEVRAAIVDAEQADTRTTLEASAARHGHATTCTEHGGRDLAACDPATCDEAALAASFTEDADPAKPAPVTSRDIGSRGYFAGLSVTVEDVDDSGPYPVALVRYAATNNTERVPADNVKLATEDTEPETFPIPDTPFYRSMAAGHRVRTGHTLQGAYVSNGDGTVRLRRTCC